MKVWRSLDEIRRDPLPAPYVTVGGFDGIHLGHRALIASLKEMARTGRGSPVVVTFDEPPRKGFGPEGIRALCYADERLDRLGAAGTEGVLSLKFDEDLRTVEADRFVEDVIVGVIHARGVCVGYDHHFGLDGRGDISLLSLLGKKHHFETRAAAPFAVDGMIVSSTLIRRKLREGDVAAANKYLGYRYEVSGEVEKGRGVGKSELDCATANVQIMPKTLPAPGVYAAMTHIRDDDGDNAEGPYASFLNLGFRPTFGDDMAEPALEVHLFDFQRDIVGRRISIQFVARLRDERKFDSLEALKKQLAEDETRARRILFSH